MNEAKNQQTPCFIDTNIWLYALIETPKDDRHTRAKQVIQEHEIILSAQIINEVCVNLLRKTQFSEQDIRGLVTSFYNNYIVIDFDRDILIKASQLRELYSLSFWDSLIVAAALRSHAEILYSEDMHHNLQVEEKLLIQNPFHTI